jgi:hypothetical protein
LPYGYEQHGYRFSTLTGAQLMPIFLDRHDLRGLTATDIAEAHRKDLEVQKRYGVRFLTYWFDDARGTGFCLTGQPDVRRRLRPPALLRLFGWSAMSLLPCLY